MAVSKNIKEILDKPKSANINYNLQFLYDLAQTDETYTESIIIYGSRLPRFFRYFLLQNYIKKNPKVVITKEWIKWINSVSKDLMEDPDKILEALYQIKMAAKVNPKILT